MDEYLSEKSDCFVHTAGLDADASVFKAEENLTAAKYLASGQFLEQAITTAYDAVHDAAVAIAASQGVRPAQDCGHGVVLGLLGTVFCGSEQAKALRNMRNALRYHDTVMIPTATDVIQAIHAAEDVVSKVKAWVEAQD